MVPPFLSENLPSLPFCFSLHKDFFLSFLDISEIMVIPFTGAHLEGRWGIHPLHLK